MPKVAPAAAKTGSQPSQRAQLLSGSCRLATGKQTPSVLRLRFPGVADHAVTLELNHGSFAAGVHVARQEFELHNGIAEVEIYAPGRPCTGQLSGPGLKLRIDFQPVKFVDRLFLEYLPIALGSILFTVFLRSYAFASFFIPSDSMADTLAVGDLVLSWNLPYKVLLQEPQRGDIVVFDHPNATHEMWVKRVIGLPGDAIESHGGQVIVNGRVLSEPYISGKSYYDFGPVIVPANQYFVMGDNRNDSEDSRFWGCMPRARIAGRTALVFWPLARAGTIKRIPPELE